MEEIIDCYLAASYLVLQAEPTDPKTWQQLYVWLLDLRKELSCRVCRKLVDRCHFHPDGFVCSECVTIGTADEKSGIITQCFKQLCTLIHESPIYNVMCARHQDRDLVELISEVLGVARPINGHNGLSSGTTLVKQEPEELNVYNYTDVNNLTSNVQLPVQEQKSNDLGIQICDVRSLKNRSPNPSVVNVPKRKKNERRLGCRCGNATTNPGKLTCFGQRCPCYTEQRPCDQCKCRGCRNPRQNRSNNANLEVDPIRRKPVTLELVSSLQPSLVKSQPTFGSYTIHDVQFPSHSRNYDQGGAEVTLGHVNSIFHSP